MTEEWPILATWRGVPVGEIPRDELEREFAVAHRRIQALEANMAAMSIREIHTLAEICRANPA